MSELVWLAGYKWRNVTLAGWLIEIETQSQ